MYSHNDNATACTKVCAAINDVQLLRVEMSWGRCSCKTVGLRCTEICDCSDSGETCANIAVEEQEEEEQDEDEDDDMLM